MGIKGTGFKGLGKELNKLAENAKKLEEGQSVTFTELFTERFMSKYTRFTSIEEFFEKSPFEVQTNEDFDKINKAELDKYVSENTQFSSWENMLGEAGKEHIARQLGF
ncbi:hypothetical protein [Bacillus thermotolerans]|uniref:Uncharacterized protein n=1 Tax=Bacillus thermotolerans TaxID=1221996 RepID=A0A0F5HL78_BACTR|nr:hypothetical protein [Bacillus thermotolerans]KKB34139.1 hypothetical protein QY95_04025 [Bacillus thermotolerans]